MVCLCCIRFCVKWHEIFVCHGNIFWMIKLILQGANHHAALPQLSMARAFISFQRFLTRALNKTDTYYQKKHMLYIICNTSNEF